MDALIFMLDGTKLVSAVLGIYYLAINTQIKTQRLTQNQAHTAAQSVLKMIMS